MDATFRESIPFYGEKAYLSFMLEHDSTSSYEASREGESGDGDVSASNDHQQRKMDVVISGSIPEQQRTKEMANFTSSQIDEPMCERWQHKNITQVYSRKKLRSQTQATEVVPRDEPEVVDVSSTSEAGVESSSSIDVPIALQKNTRANVGVPPPRYGFENDISNYVSYASLSPAYRAFVTSL
jgi:hypothetical protein